MMRAYRSPDDRLQYHREWRKEDRVKRVALDQCINGKAHGPIHRHGRCKPCYDAKKASDRGYADLDRLWAAFLDRLAMRSSWVTMLGRNLALAGVVALQFQVTRQRPALKKLVLSLQDQVLHAS